MAVGIKIGPGGKREEVTLSPEEIAAQDETGRAVSEKKQAHDERRAAYNAENKDLLDVLKAAKPEEIAGIVSERFKKPEDAIVALFKLLADAKTV